MFFLFMVCFSIGCFNYNKEEDYYKEVEVTVLSETTLIKCCSPNFTGEREAMIVKKKNDKTDYLFLDEIRGFTYERGFEYLLLIKEKYLANAPQDVKSVEYHLIEELSKQKK